MIEIKPGKTIKIVKVNVVIYGDGNQDADYQKIIEDGNSFIGKTLHHDDYEQFKNRLYNLAVLKGYFDAKFINSQLVVVPVHYQCIWNIKFYTGQRYIIEKIVFKNSQIKMDYLRNLSSIYSGSYYDAMSVMTLNRHLYSTNWFNSVLISSDIVCFQKKNWF